MAVAFDAKMTGGNADTGRAQNASATSVSSTGMTIGASATLLVAFVGTQHASAGSSTVTATWAGVSMTAGPILENTTTNVMTIAMFYKVNPTTGNQTLTITWTGQTGDSYMSCISFTGTDTTTGVNTAHNTTATGLSLSVTSDSTGATVGAFISQSGLTPTVGGTPTPTTIFAEAPLNPGGGASYTIGGSGTNSHTFTGGSNQVCAGVHVIAAAAGSPTIVQSHYRWRNDDGTLVGPVY